MPQVPQTDTRTGITGGLLDKAKAEGVLPKIFYTNTSYEYWSRAASLIHTSPDGKRDLALMDNVRIYMLSGLQHFSGPFPPTRGNNPSLLGRHAQNPNPVWWMWRALVANMDGWVREGIEPPASKYPKIEDGTLVPLDKVEFPAIPGVSLPANVHTAYRMDYGPRWKEGITTVQPPVVREPFPVLLPQVGRDGNEPAGVRPPELLVPLATYTGWNLRDPQTGMQGERVSFIGSYLPLAKTKRERELAGDTRLSIEERYRSREEYLGKYALATLGLVRDRFLLPADVQAVLERGEQEWLEATR